ncbi:MAG TPA: hypothetical protein VF792_06420 [Ktedonobacterales bacterium]
MALTLACPGFSRIAPTLRQQRSPGRAALAHGLRVIGYGHCAPASDSSYYAVAKSDAAACGSSHMAYRNAAFGR